MSYWEMDFSARYPFDELKDKLQSIPGWTLTTFEPETKYSIPLTNSKGEGYSWIRSKGKITGEFRYKGNSELAKVTVVFKYGELPSPLIQMLVSLPDGEEKPAWMRGRCWRELIAELGGKLEHNYD